MALLNQLFHKMTAKPAPAQSPEATVPPPEPESARRLRPLLDGKRLLKVQIDGREYQSLLLALDCARGLLWLDELFPRARPLVTGDELTVSHYQNHQLIEFTGPVVGSGRGGFALPLPESVYCGPRRRWPRLDVFGWHPISAQLAVPGQSPASAEVHNLSAGGARLSLSGDWRPLLRKGEVLPLCAFTVAPGIRVRCRVRVCAFSLNQRPWRQTLVSLAFVDLDRQSREDLARFVAHRVTAQRHAPAEAA
ncbi:flagellar brake protein [Marinimicrobium sp. C2-29]|uniref:flagellar brake protein n=1 Tax=Marinimicrobium sp. C2-29 TaxID=3139825 RepID=UPI003139AEC3